VRYNIALCSTGFSSSPAWLKDERVWDSASLCHKSNSQIDLNFGGEMKRWAWILAIPVLISLAGAQVTSSLNSPQNPAQASSSQASEHDADSGERMFFPHDMLWGWAQLDLAPPHNEIDPNLCSGDVAANGGIQDPCSLFARYMLSGILEVRPFGRGPLRRFMVYGAPTFLFGKTLPKTLYTWSPDAIGIEHSWGVGIYLNKGFEFRITQHFLFDRLGARDKNLGPADLGNNGPWGRYVTVGVRKTFGTRRW
jgi:hypothetical protein